MDEPESWGCFHDQRVMRISPTRGSVEIVDDLGVTFANLFWYDILPEYVVVWKFSLSGYSPLP